MSVANQNTAAIADYIVVGSATSGFAGSRIPEIMHREIR